MAADTSETWQIIIEVQRMIECNRYRPLAASELSDNLSPDSSQFLREKSMVLIDVLSQYPQNTACWLHEGKVVVSLAGFPWLGAFSKPPELGAFSKPPGLACQQSTATAIKPIGTDRLQRGQALTMIECIADMPAMQDSLREMSTYLLKVQDKTCLVSTLGTALSDATRSLLRSLKIRAVQLLRCFPDDFHIEEAGAGSTVTYKQASAKTCYVPAQQSHKITAARFGRLLKLCDDMTSQVCEHIPGLSVTNLKTELQKGGCLLIDCRSEEEYLIGCIPNALRQSKVTPEVLEKCRICIAYCCVGADSAVWCEKSTDETCPDNMKMHASKCFYLIGGVAAWAHSDGEFFQASTGSRNPQVHCPSPALADFFPATGYELLSPAQLSQSVPSNALAQVSKLRSGRLHDLAWEVRLHHFNSVLCLEPDDIIQASDQNLKGMILIDCRSRDEFEISTLDVKLPMLTLEQLMQDFAEVSRVYGTLVMFCTIGGRSGMRSEELLVKLSSGEISIPGPAPKVKNMLGGIAAWLHAGGGLVDMSGIPSWRVHTWVKQFMDLFPVGPHQLICGDAEATVKDAKPFIDCCRAPSKETASTRIVRSCMSLAPEALADELGRAASKAHYTD